MANGGSLPWHQRRGGRWLHHAWCCLLLALLVGCAHTPNRTPTPTPTPTQPSATSAVSSASVTPSPSTLPVAYDLFTKGRAAEVVAQLVAAADGKPVVRVVLNRTSARLTYVDEGERPRSVVWQAGRISPSDDGTDLVAATSFDPLRFNLSDIETLFATAAEVSGSKSRQELQINEYDHGQIYLTVTTTPESSTVFFDRDGVLVPRLDFSVAQDVATGIADVLENRLIVIEIGMNADQVWADVLVSPGVVERRIRPANQPMYLTQRRENPPGGQFEASMVDPEVLARLMRIAPDLVGEVSGSPVAVRVFQPVVDAQPQILVDVDGTQLVRDLSGVPLAEG